MTLEDDIRKAWFKSKTILFNLLMILSGVAAMFQPVIDELAATGMSTQTIAVLRVTLMLVGIVGTALRAVTSGAVTLK